MNELNQIRTDLLSDLLLFIRVMFEKRTGREFALSNPIGNQSHFITVCKELTDVFLLKTTRLMINLPPGWGKSELCKGFAAWCFAHYPDSKFLYLSHSHDLASTHTHSIKQILQMPLYKQLFGIEIPRDSSAKDFFQTTQGGAMAAFGSQGGITGRDAGLPGQDRFTGLLLIDDIHKPDEVHSDTIREKVIRNYYETIERRLRAPNVPIVMIGQRLHEYDLPAHLLSGADGQEWKSVIIKGIDDAGNAVYPEVNPKSQLLTMKEKQPYVFSSQYQQDPLPAGGGLFKEDWFYLVENHPEIITTFVTVDTAETEKEYNDATVFSFWGLHKIKFKESEIDGLYGLHWIDCMEIRIDPKDLEEAFLDFWTSCMRYKVKPKLAAIEKKSTGVTLLSVLKRIQGLQTLPIERNKQSGSKTDRFLELQPFIANRQISLPSDGKHTKMCVEHMRKITANNTHRFDDIADTCYDAVKIALIDKTIINKEAQAVDYNEVATTLMKGYRQSDRLRKAAYGNSRNVPRPLGRN